MTTYIIDVSYSDGVTPMHSDFITGQPSARQAAARWVGEMFSEKLADQIEQIETDRFRFIHHETVITLTLSERS